MSLGVVYRYALSSLGAWTFAGKILGSGLNNSGFGHTIAIGNNETEMMITESYEFAGTNGKACHFIRNQTSWTLMQTLQDFVQTPGSYFGSALILSGNVAFVGAGAAKVTMSKEGMSYFY